MRRVAGLTPWAIFFPPSGTIPGPRALSVVSSGNLFALPSSMCNTYVAQNIFSRIVLFSPIRFNVV